METRRCEFRNCRLDITGRLNKKYCCRNHKVCEMRMRKRCELKMKQMVEYVAMVKLIKNNKLI